MILIVCVDDRYGMLFNKRRVSSDRAVTHRVMEMTGGKLWMSPYSAKLFGDVPESRVDEDFLSKAGAGEFCFAECDVSASLEQAERVVLYRWNRHYPSDVKFPADSLAAGWRLVSTAEFHGNSHEIITEEVYER